MGIDPRRLNDRQLDMITDPRQRKAVVRRRGLGETASKTAEKAIVRRELELHEEYISFLKRHEFGYIHADPSRKSTIKKGAPDFTVTKGVKYLYAEFKREDGVFSDAQKKHFAFLERIGCPLFIWRDYETASRKTAEFFGLDLHVE